MYYASGPNIGGNLRADSSNMELTLGNNYDGFEEIKFRVDEYMLGVTYTAGDTLTLVTKEGYKKALTRDGSIWKFTPDSTDFGGFTIKPGSSRTFSANFVYTRSSTSVHSATFNLVVKRNFSWSPLMISNTLYGWFDPMWNPKGDGTSLSADATVNELKSVAPTYGFSLYEGTNAPVNRQLGNLNNLPRIVFDGTNDLMTLMITNATPSVNASIIPPFGFYMLAEMMAIPASTKSLAFYDGSTNDLKLQITSTGQLQCSSGGYTGNETATAGTVIAGERFVLSFRQNTDGNQPYVRKNWATAAQPLTGTTYGVVGGPFKLGTDGTTFTNFALYGLVITSGSISAGDDEALVRYLAAMGGINI